MWGADLYTKCAFPGRTACDLFTGACKPGALVIVEHGTKQSAAGGPPAQTAWIGHWSFFLFIFTVVERSTQLAAISEALRARWGSENAPGCSPPARHSAERKTACRSATCTGQGGNSAAMVLPLPMLPPPPPPPSPPPPRCHPPFHLATTERQLSRHHCLLGWQGTLVQCASTVSNT